MNATNLPLRGAKRPDLTVKASPTTITVRIEGREVSVSGRAARMILRIVKRTQRINDPEQGQVTFNFSGESLKVDWRESEEC